jgi:sulfur carrier protein ThiS
MVVTVRLHTILQRKLPGRQRRFELQLVEGNTLLDLVRQLELEVDPELLLYAVNGRVAEADQELQDGDVVNLMAAISGGMD